MEEDYMNFPEFRSLKKEYEKPSACYNKNLGSKAWSEPRMFTLQ